MSALKNKIKLQQAQAALSRGPISQEQFDAIQAECTGIPAEAGQVAGGIGLGSQLGPVDLPPVATAKKTTTARKATAPKAPSGHARPGVITNAVEEPSTTPPAGNV